ncbi:Mov34/MPN/PAD-1 family protein [Pararhodospirillum photometricum]|uniref:Mov34/MPN/PAD-1 family protein n=1 Tax=Pararhodospirillum photometricum TaxID=1084 RepID=UPI0002D6286D|nr:M67 family metallopeptidase [Pararhodospirillum photometricum]
MAADPLRRLILPKTLAEALVAGAREALPCEVCGLLVGRRVGDAAVVEAGVAVANTDPRPETGFAINPYDRLAVQRAARAEGWGVLGSWHSHPSGEARPSARDAAQATEGGLVWLIVAPHVAEVAAFVAVCGAGQGAFLALEIVLSGPGPASPACPFPPYL